MQQMSSMAPLSLEEVKNIELDILDCLHAFCESHGLRYFITAGTLIGALRHQGYIPWDDDIDVVMLQPDYDRLVASFNVGRTDSYRLLSHTNGDRTPFSFAKICDERTVMVEDEARARKYPMGVNIDIFPLDSLSDDYEEAVRLLNRTGRYASVVSLKNIVRDKKRAPVKQAAIYVLQAFAGLFSYDWLFRKIDGLVDRYSGNADSKYVANAKILAKREREIVERDWFSASVDLTFEGRTYKAPAGYDAYLRRLFGDYMQLPPEEERVSHHDFRSYRKEAAR